MESIRKLLEYNPIRFSAPCRVDMGGTWDIKAMALPLERVTPTTVNMALDLRTTVSLHPFSDGRVKIVSRGFTEPQTCRAEDLSFAPPFGLFFAAVSYFGFHGLEVRITAASPVKSALGGSSTALVALTAALNNGSTALGRRNLSRKEILHLTYHLEDGISGGNCGIQDQAAAVYGGVHQWQWQFGRASAPIRRIPLLDAQGCNALSRHLLVAYSGESHVAATTNRQWIRDFLSGKTRTGWIDANQAARAFGRAVKSLKWEAAAAYLRREVAIRREITPEAFNGLTKQMVFAAEQLECGARFTGAGAGGCLWALGPTKSIRQVAEKWERMIETVDGAKLLEPKIDPEGIRPDLKALTGLTGLGEPN